MPLRRPPTVASALLSVALPFGLALGCTKKLPDQACAASEVACFDERTGLFCRSGMLATMTCLGPAGCQKVGKDDVACDNPVARVGDGCNQIEDGACTEDGKSALTCRGYAFVVSQACKGPRGCKAQGDRVSCDHALAEPGDPCATEGDTACQVDRSAFLRCTKGTFHVSNGCRGAKRCSITGKPDEDEHFECDDSITEIGDPCEDEGETSCSVDRKTLDVCKAHRIAVSKPCPGPHACSEAGSAAHFDCDAIKKK